MELGIAIIIFAATIAIPASLFPIFKYKYGSGINKNKQKKVREDTLLTLQNQNFRETQESYEARIKTLKEDLISVQRSNSRYKALLNKYKDMELEDNENGDEVEDIESNYDIDWVKASQIGQQLGLDTSKIDPNNPILTNYIKDKILENKDIAIFMGILRPKGAGNSGQIPPQQAGGQQDFTNSNQSIPQFETL